MMISLFSRTMATLFDGITETPHTSSNFSFSWEKVLKENEVGKVSEPASTRSVTVMVFSETEEEPGRRLPASEAAAGVMIFEAEKPNYQYKGTTKILTIGFVQN